MLKRMVLTVLVLSLVALTAFAQTSLSLEEAKEIALSHAGVLAEDAVFIEEKADVEDGAQVYELEFLVNGREFDYEIDVHDGTVRAFDADADGYDAQSGVITADAALDIALYYAGLTREDVKVEKVERDTDDGRIEYEIEFRVGRTEYECTVNAQSGAIVEWDTDD